MAITKPTALDKEVALEITQDFFEKFEFCCNQSKTPIASDLEKFLSPHFRITSNGKVMAKSLDEYISRMSKFQQKYSHMEITNLIVDTLSSGYQIVARYTIYLTSRTGNKRQVEIIAIAALENHRFVSWDLVANDHGAEHWDEQ